MTTSLESGRKGEALAETFLLEQGFKIVEKNFRSRFGEIDLIAVDKNTLVFIEVRKRKNNRFGEAYETVNRSKQQKIVKTALFFLQSKKQYNNHPMRFDVIGISATTQPPRIDWIENAFDAEI